MSEGTTPKNRLGWLDVTRGIASVIVLVQHLLEQQIPAFKLFTMTWLNLGQTGVSAFFLVSGFVIPYSLERAGSLKTFWISRFFRLYPLYWASFIAVLLLSAGGIWLHGEGFDPKNIKHLALNVTMIQGLLKQPHALDVYWTLSLEMLFYWLVSFAFAAKFNKKSFHILLGFAAFMILFGIIAPYILGRRLPVGGRFFYIQTALFGTLIFRYLAGEATLKQVLIGLGVLILVEAGLCVTYQQFLDRSPEAFDIPPIAMFNSAFAGYLIFFAVFACRSMTMPKPLLHLGLVSYSVYLLHPFIIFTMPMSPWPSLNLLLTIAAVWGLSTITYHAIEKPFQSLGKRFAKPKSQRQSPE